MTSEPSLIAKFGWSGRAVFIALLQFLRKPSLAAAEEVPPVSRPFLILWLLIFAYGATAVVGLLAVPMIVGSEVAVGEKLDHVLSGSSWTIFVALVVLGPLVEEMIFRGWLTGSYQAIAGAALFLALFFGGVMGWEITGNGKLGLGSQLGVAAVALLVFTMVQRVGAPARPPGFGALFPYLFWLQGLIFGALHFANLHGSSLALPVLMGSSLVICGWLFAYARIVAGFGAACLLHALYNMPAAAGAIFLPLLRG